MSEIGKMYENTSTYKNLCECAPKNLYDYCINYGQDGCTHPISEIINGCKHCKLAEQNVKYYPPFTAEKQLEIVKQILFSTWWMNLKRLQFAEKFDEGLAQMINELWQDLTEEEKQQVKGILE